ncbi:hypothetical protein C7N43_12545 [Sphingobacteriales bacterium UPWRP_1]|nr:hypothetical protein B6N25_03930 [Sphingobacteriales bacterium TSM_CSS]PSJ76673.1 hypothetical protein C7N43_12545 [Sphingobacteriales bacterium UPWRP_1]
MYFVFKVNLETTNLRKNNTLNTLLHYFVEIFCFFSGFLQKNYKIVFALKAVVKLLGQKKQCSFIIWTKRTGKGFL